jgi:PHD/YefM family antitoxin component YafN of YafNO toxin-antitoxin module
MIWVTWIGPRIPGSRAGAGKCGATRVVDKKFEKFGFFDYFCPMEKPETNTPPRVSSSEFLKSYGALSRRAQREPVTITNHGQDSLVLISAEEFKRLKALDTRRAYYPWELPEELKQALEEAEPPAWTAQFDHELDEK